MLVLSVRHCPEDLKKKRKSACSLSSQPGLNFNKVLRGPGEGLDGRQTQDKGSPLCHHRLSKTAVVRRFCSTLTYVSRVGSWKMNDNLLSCPTAVWSCVLFDSSVVFVGVGSRVFVCVNARARARVWKRGESHFQYFVNFKNWVLNRFCRDLKKCSPAT